MEENGKLNDVFNEGENSQDSEKKSEYSQEGTNRDETSTQLDESSQLSQENESKDEQKDAGEEVEEEKYDDSEINAKNLEILHSDINYGIVLAFIDKFGKHFSFKEIKFDQFEQNIINIRSLNKNLSDIFLNLLRNLSFGKYVRKEKFDYYMTKFTNRFSHDDALEIEKSGYAKLKIESKITIIKNLLESQFDENQKLKQIIAEQTPDQNSLRTEPSGKDLNGLWYFVYMDSECSVRVFSINHREINEDLTSWKLVAKNLNDLKLLVEQLSTEPALEKLRSCKS
ncbi:remodeling and spacing factor 1-like [Brachionus plicatilis]|uniref:Remodeling and spacing factor 1-like n=1 Tax=Brachionus plicatilis TaxID=10195 RepID=A0A3M7RLG9_BRAPC|nr:remodeling and spacing factor 1-like [Brachionus plicatilis]